MFPVLLGPSAADVFLGSDVLTASFNNQSWCFSNSHIHRKGMRAECRRGNSVIFFCPVFFFFFSAAKVAEALTWLILTKQVADGKIASAVYMCPKITHLDQF